MYLFSLPCLNFLARSYIIYLSSVYRNRRTSKKNMNRFSFFDSGIRRWLCLFIFFFRKIIVKLFNIFFLRRMIFFRFNIFLNKIYFFRRSTIFIVSFKSRIFILIRFHLRIFLIRGIIKLIKRFRIILWRISIRIILFFRFLLNFYFISTWVS